MQEEEVDRGSESGEMDAGLQMDTGALLLEMVGTEVLEGGVNCPLVPLSELTSRAGEFFFLAGRTLFWPPFCCCCCCCRHLARRFLNHTLRQDTREGERKSLGLGMHGQTQGRKEMVAGRGRPKTVPQEQRVAGCCREKLRGSPSLRSLAVITSGNHKSNSLIRALLGRKGSAPSLLFASQGPPGITVSGLLKSSPQLETIEHQKRREQLGKQRFGMGRVVKMSHLPSKQALCSHPLGQSWPLSPPYLPLAGPKGAGSGEVFLGRRMGFGVGPSQSQPPRSIGTRHHTASGSLVRRRVGGMAEEMPCLCCWGVLGPRGGRTLLPCQQHLQNAVWMGSLQRTHSSASGEEFPPPRQPFSHQIPFRRGGSPQSVLV